MISVNIDIPKVAKDAYGTIGGLVRLIRDVKTDYSLSLPAHIKATNITSRMYIDETLYNEPILLHLISVLNQMYAGYIFTALQINQYVEGANTIRQLLETVGTENYVKLHDEEDSSKAFLALENNMDVKGQKLISGRVIKVDLNIPSANGNASHKTSVNLFVQLLPYVISPRVAIEFLKLNFVASMSSRLRKVKAGELSFISDYLFERDLINDRKRALKEDSTGLLYDMLASSSNALSKALMGYSGLVRVNHNTANTIIIVSKAAIDAMSLQQGINIKSVSDRNKFFRLSMAMMLVVVDLHTDMVQIYFNGLEGYGDYSFNMVQANSDGGGGKDALSMVDVMTAISRGMTPRL